MCTILVHQWLECSGLSLYCLSSTKNKLWRSYIFIDSNTNNAVLTLCSSKILLSSKHMKAVCRHLPVFAWMSLGRILNGLILVWLQMTNLLGKEAKSVAVVGQNDVAVKITYHRILVKRVGTCKQNTLSRPLNTLLNSDQLGPGHS